VSVAQEFNREDKGGTMLARAMAHNLRSRGKKGRRK
jgi:hypothetical protein